MIPTAKHSIRDAWLSSDFGESMARRHFSDEQIEALGTYSRGSRVGKTRGKIRWLKVESGGFVYLRRNGFVEKRRGQVVVVELIDSNDTIIACKSKRFDASEWADGLSIDCYFSGILP